MMWWVLAKFLHEKNFRMLPHVPEGGMNKWTDSERIENILRIIKAIHMTVEKTGVKEENLSPEVVKASEEGYAPEEDGENLNSMTISFIMGRRPDHCDGTARVNPPCPLTSK
jgi:hypothetical protein